jgi:hypothetical protein
MNKMDISTKQLDVLPIQINTNGGDFFCFFALSGFPKYARRYESKLSHTCPQTLSLSVEFRLARPTSPFITRYKKCASQRGVSYYIQPEIPYLCRSFSPPFLSLRSLLFHLTLPHQSSVQNALVGIQVSRRPVYSTSRFESFLFNWSN